MGLSLTLQIFASESRIQAMGRTDDYMDDVINIFFNPALILKYNPLLVGEVGRMASHGDSIFSAQPIDPWYGGIVSLGGETKICLGLVINRPNVFTRFVESTFLDFKKEFFVVPPEIQSTGEGFVAITVKNKYSVGGNIYTGFGRDNTLKNDERARDTWSVMILGTGGLYADLTDKFAIDVSGGLGNFFYAMEDIDSTVSWKSGLDSGFVNYSIGLEKIELPAVSLFFRGKFKLKVTEHLILMLPLVKLEQYGVNYQIKKFNQVKVDSSGLTTVRNALPDVEKKVYTFQNLVLGMGFNWQDDVTDFYVGLNGVQRFDKRKNENEDIERANDYFGFLLNFGIERRIIWEWLALRTGGQKLLAIGSRVTKVGNIEYKSNPLVTNPDSDGSEDDMLSMGLGIVVDNKLNLDFVISESFPFRMGSLFSGDVGNVFTRFSATYNFGGAEKE